MTLCLLHSLNCKATTGRGSGARQIRSRSNEQCTLYIHVYTCRCTLASLLCSRVVSCVECRQSEGGDVTYCSCRETRPDCCQLKICAREMAPPSRLARRSPTTRPCMRSVPTRREISCSLADCDVVVARSLTQPSHVTIT